MSQNDIAGSWSSLQVELSTYTQRIIQCMGFDQMTPVQAAVIPLFLQRKDVVVEAVTGSGKSLAFLIPIVEMMIKRAEPLKPRHIGALIVCPTRELASQLHNVLLSFIPKLDEEDVPMSIKQNLRCMLVTGGRPASVDIAEICVLNPTILVATPGKLEELVRLKAFVSKDLEVLVLDEGDHLLNLGFAQALRDIISYLPKQRRTGLFSATITDAVNELMKVGLRNPVKVVVKVEDKLSKAVQRTPSTLKILYSLCAAENKFSYLLRCLLERPHEKCIVYFATCFQVEYFYKIVNQLDFLKQLKFFALHGKMESKKRPAVLNEYCNIQSGVLLCTDVAARGIDFPDVDFVLQYDPPQDPQAFLHRCGRTARSGRIGTAQVILMPHEDTYVEYLSLKKIPLAEANDIMELPTDLGKAAVLPDYYSQRKDRSSLEQIVHSLVFRDRALFDAQVRAFVSYIKSYQEHQLKFIFAFNQLPIDGVMKQFMLITEPKCPEVKQWKLEHCSLPTLFSGSVLHEDLVKIPYLDKVREKQRQAVIKSRPVNVVKKTQRNDAWSIQKAIKEKRQERHTKKDRKRKAILLDKMKEIKEQEELKKQEKELQDENDDWKSFKAEQKERKRIKADV